MDTPVSTGRDPVCESIESLLSDLEADGHKSLIQTKSDGMIRLTFDRLTVAAETYDIALVRLASAMMDDGQYCALLMNALREPMKSSA